MRSSARRFFRPRPVPPRRVFAEFALLLGLSLLGYGLQAVWEPFGEILAVPFYLAAAFFFLVRGRALAAAQAPLVAAVFGAWAGRASASIYGGFFRAAGAAALLLLPLYIAVGAPN